MVFYLIGNILIVYIVIKLRYNVDIRDEGSGNFGVRNMGCVYGKGYFIVIFLGDVIKGVIVVVVVKYFFEDFIFVMLILLVVIIGYIYLVLFKGKGGKGILIFIGGLIVFDYLIVFIFLGIFIVFYLIFKGFMKLGLIMIVCLLICMIFYFYFIVIIILSGIIIVFILYVN